MSAPMVEVGDIILALKRVTDYLVKRNKVTDDTVIHSLFYSIKLNLHSIDEIENVALEKFVLDVAKNCPDLDTSTVVFGLELAGWLGGSIDYYRHFKGSIHEVFLTVWEKVQSEAICDVSITTAIYECLTMVARHAEGLTWIVHEKKLEDLTCHGLRHLVNCSSIFLQKAVIKYLSTVITELEGTENVPALESSQIFITTVLTAVTENIRNHFKEKQVGQFVPGSLQLLETLCKQAPGTSVILLSNYMEFCKFLLAMIDSLNARDCDAVMNILSALLKLVNGEEDCSEELMNPLIKKIENKLTDLAIKGNILTAQKLAACCLQSTCSKCLEERCTAILKQPILWILGDSIEQGIFPEKFLQESLSTRSRSSDVVCRSLNISMMRVNDITELLKRTVVYSACVEKSNSKTVSLMYKNRKVQRQCLECLNQITQHKTDDDVSSLLDRAQIVVEIFKEPDGDTVIYSLCSQLLLEWLPKLLKDVDAVSLTTSLAQIFQFHLSALNWELRDTTLELLGKIIQMHKENNGVTQWILEHRLHVHIWQCVKDGESYVRASAITALYQLCQSQQLLTALVNTGLISDEMAIIKDIENIVENDTEAFARRSAVTFLLDTFKVKLSSNVKVISSAKVGLDFVTDHVIATVVKATRDFDWEVKMIALEFIALFLQLELSECSDSDDDGNDQQELTECPITRENLPDVPEYAHHLYSLSNKCSTKINLKKLNSRSTFSQVVRALIEVLDDYDEKVSEKALDIFTDLQKHLCKDVGTLNGMTESGNHCEPIKKKRKLKDIDTKVKSDTMYDSKIAVEVSSELQDSTKTENKLGHINERHHNESGDKGNNVEIAEAVNTILDFDISVYRSRSEQVHDKVCKLVSLVEDIVTASDNDDEENAADCY